MADDPEQTGPNTSENGAESTKVLKGLDAVRKRRGMHIRDTQAIHAVILNERYFSRGELDQLLQGGSERAEVSL